MRNNYLRIATAIFILAITGCSTVHLKRGLTAYYPFNGNANDVTKNNNNPVFNNATLTSDRAGNVNSAYHFDGVDNYIKILNSPSLNIGNQISICAWIRPTGFYKGLCHGNSVLQKGDYGNTGAYLIDFDDNLYTKSHNCNGLPPDTLHETFGEKDVPEVLPYVIKNNWYYFVFTDDGVSSKIYINAILKITYPSKNKIYTDTDDLFFGENSSNQLNYPFWFNGDLDDVRIYNRAINSKEVKKIANIY